MQLLRWNNQGHDTTPASYRERAGCREPAVAALGVVFEAHNVHPLSFGRLRVGLHKTPLLTWVPEGVRGVFESVNLPQLFEVFPLFIVSDAHASTSPSS